MLQKRGRFYYFRWVVPVDLRSILKSTALVKSLNTSDIWEARNRATLYASAVQNIRKQRTDFLMGYLTEEDYQSKVRVIWKTARVYILGAEHYEFSDEQEHNQVFTGLGSISTIFNKASKGLSFKGVIDGEDCVLSTDVERMLVSSIFENMKLEDLDDEDRNVIKKLRNEWLKSRAYAAQQMRSEIDFESPIVPPACYFELEKDDTKEGAIEEGLLFSDCYRQFLAHKIDIEKITEKVQAEYSKFYSDWSELMKDKPINQFKRKDIEGFLRVVSDLPKRNRKEYKGKSVRELMGMNYPKTDKISANSAGQYKKWIQGVFAYARRQDYINDSPVKDLNVNLSASDNTYADYNSSEMRSLISAALNESLSWRKWVVLIAAYTGMRLGEIVALTKASFKVDSDSKRNYILVTDAFGGKLKTDAGKRAIPIHQRLLDYGILTWVDNSESDRLFSIKEKTVTQWFGGVFRLKAGVEYRNDYGKRKVFHSFRHTVVTMTRSAGVDVHLVQQVVGHETSSAGVTDRYTHKSPVKDLLVVIDSIDYGL